MFELDWHAESLLKLILLQFWLAAAGKWCRKSLLAGISPRESEISTVLVFCEVLWSTLSFDLRRFVGRKIRNFSRVRMASRVLFIKQARFLGCLLASTLARRDVLFVRGRLEIDLRVVSGLRASYGRQITVLFGFNTRIS